MIRRQPGRSKHFIDLQTILSPTLERPSSPRHKLCLLPGHTVGGHYRPLACRPPDVPRARLSPLDPPKAPPLSPHKQYFDGSV